MKRIIVLITILAGISLVCAGQTDSLVTELLNASVITEGNMTYKIDRTTHFFTKEQISHAREARDLVSEIPGLFIDQQSNSIKTVGAKNVLVLINGVRAEEYELQLISPEKVRKVDYYDVPPVKYMDEAAAVINVHTSRLDTGWAGNFYGRGGQLYSNARASLGYVIGYNKFTLDLGAHINPKRDVQDTEEGLYSCLIDGQDYIDMIMCRKVMIGAANMEVRSPGLTLVTTTIPCRPSSSCLMLSVKWRERGKLNLTGEILHRTV